MSAMAGVSELCNVSWGSFFVVTGLVEVVVVDGVY
jgi:hypothetical protein